MIESAILYSYYYKALQNATMFEPLQLITPSNRARNWQERGKKTRIIVRDRTRNEIEKSPENGAFLVAAI